MLKFAILQLIVLMMILIANAQILSGFPGLESVPGPELPKIDSFTRFNGRYHEFLRLSCLHTQTILRQIS